MRQTLWSVLLAMVLVAGRGEAAVVSTGFRAGVIPARGLFFDVLTGDFGMFLPSGQIRIDGDGELAVAMGGVKGGILTSNGMLANLEVGEWVGSSPDIFSGLGFAQFGTGPGDWRLESVNRFGVRFYNRFSQAFHYGWGLMYVGPDVSLRSLELFFWETEPESPILVTAAGTVVGSPTTPIPEPGTGVVVLGLVAMLRRGCQERKRRTACSSC